MGARLIQIGIIYKTFQGELTMTTRLVDSNDGEPTIKKMPFLFLSFDLPAIPIFTDEDKNIIPQIPLGTLLNRYDSVTIQVPSWWLPGARR